MKKIILQTIVLCFLCLPFTVHGADFYFEQSNSLSTSGAEQIVLKVKTGQDRVNALTGKIKVPEGIEVSRINTGSSAIVLWIEQPQVGKEILFSGVTPGGFQGDMSVFSFEYSKKDKVTSVLSIVDAEAIKDDGLGTSVQIAAIPFKVPESRSGLVNETRDTDSPEPFDIVIGKNGDTFNGSYFASFAAQDKRSGIQQYQYAQTFVFSPNDSDWAEVSSPLVLKNMALIKNISIKAIDGEGNIQISTVSGPYRYTVLWIGIIIVLTLCALFFFVRRYLYRSS